MFSLIYLDSRDIREWEKLAHTIFYFFETPYCTFLYCTLKKVYNKYSSELNVFDFCTKREQQNMFFKLGSKSIAVT